MIILDTDVLTFHLLGHPRVLQRRREAHDEVVITLISRIETLQGRFATLLKAADGEQLLRGQHRLDKLELDLRPFRVLPVTDHVASEFDRLRANKGLRKIGRADLLIATIALTHVATLVTRNVKDFRLVPGLTIENWLD